MDCDTITSAELDLSESLIDGKMVMNTMELLVQLLQDNQS